MRIRKRVVMEWVTVDKLLECHLDVAGMLLDVVHRLINCAANWGLPQNLAFIFKHITSITSDLRVRFSSRVHFQQCIAIIIKIKLKPWRYSQDGLKRCCQMAVQGTLWLAKRYPSTLISVFLTGFRYFSHQLLSRGWVHSVSDPILKIKKNLGYSREPNPGPLGWQSDVLTTIPNRRSVRNPKGNLIFQ